MIRESIAQACSLKGLSAVVEFPRNNATVRTVALRRMPELVERDR